MQQRASAAALAVVVAALSTALVVPDHLAALLRTVLGRATLGALLAVALLLSVVAAVRPRVRRPPRARSVSAGAREAARSLVDAVPWPLAVAVVAAVAWAAWYSLGRGNALPRIFSDELTHSTAAREFAAAGAIRADYGPLVPVVHSLGYLLTGDDVGAYRVIQAINVALMALAAFPAYLLARRVLSHSLALVVSALTVALPWIVYSRFVMTEGVFYLVFLLFLLALVRALERPTLGRQAVLALGLALAFAARTQAVVLPAAVVAAVVLYGSSRATLRRVLREFLPTWLLYGAGAAGVAVLLAAGVWNPLGAYDVLVEDIWRHPRGLALWAGSNLTALSLGLGVLALPAAALGTVALLRRPSKAGEAALAASALSATAVVLFTVVVLAASPYGQGIVHERSLFYVAPLILICALAWTTRDEGPSTRVTAVIVAGVIALMATMPRGVITSTSVDALSFKLWTQLDRDWLPAWWQMLLAVVVGALVVALLRSTTAVVLTVVLAAIGVAGASDYRTDVPRSLVRNYAWVDRALGDEPSGAPGVKALVFWLGCPDEVCAAEDRTKALEKLALYTEFFNSRVGRVAHVHGDNAARGLPTAQLAVREDGVVTTADGTPLRPRLVLADARLALAGTRVASLRASDVGESSDAGLALWRVPGVLRIRGGRDLLAGT